VPYGDLSGLYTVFPTGKRPANRAQPKAKKAKKAKAKRPCKYGPRDADGLCPKKPKKARAPKVTKAERSAERRLKTILLSPLKTRAGTARVKRQIASADWQKIGQYAGAATSFLTGPAALAAVTAAAALIALNWKDARKQVGSGATAATVQKQLLALINRNYAKASDAARAAVGGRPLTPAERSVLDSRWAVEKRALDRLVTTLRSERIY
jgi:hypothetical protein